MDRVYSNKISSFMSCRHDRIRDDRPRTTHQFHYRRIVITTTQKLAGPSAAGLVYRLKTLGHSAELVTEYAKDALWMGIPFVFMDQIHVFGEQHARISRVYGKVDIVVTGAPAIMACVYGQASPELKALALTEHKRRESLNFFVERHKPYHHDGRRETLAEARAIYDRIRLMLYNAKIQFSVIQGNAQAVDEMLPWILFERYGPDDPVAAE